MTKRPCIEDLADVAIPSQPSLSSDGDRIVYVLRTQDVELDRNVDQLWVVPVEGGSSRRLTAGPDDTAPAWSPDGGKIAFLRGGQLTLLEPGTIDAEQLTELPFGAGAPAWSPDGRRLAFTAPVAPSGGERVPAGSDAIDYQRDGWQGKGRVRNQLHVFDLDTHELRQLTDGPHDAGAPAWSPDGTTLAYAAPAECDNDLSLRVPVQLIRVDVPLARPRVLAFAGGVVTTVSWFGDGSALLVTGWTGHPSGHSRLYRVAVSDGATTDLASEVDRNVMSGASAMLGDRPAEVDGRVWFCLREQSWTHLWSVASEGGRAQPLVADDVLVSGLSVGEGVAAMALSTSTSFGEIAVVDLDSGSRTVLTDHGVSTAGLDFYPREEKWFTLEDGTSVQSWLMYDHDRPGPMPLLLDIHGGPHNAWSGALNSAHLYHQELVDRGWAVLLVNPRGSDGFGEEFYTGIQGRCGVADSPGLLEPIDQLVLNGFADPDRLAVAGYGYGGYMACWLTGHDARFAVAIAGGAASDLVSLGGTSDDRRLLSAFELGEAPGADSDNYAEMSPFARVGAVRTPTLLLHGADDSAFPLGQAQLWHAALKERGVPANLVVYPDASHGFVVFGKPSHRIDYNRRLVDWIELHVGRDGHPRVDGEHWRSRLAHLARRHKVPGAQLGILRIGNNGFEDELVEAAHGVLSVRTGVPAGTDSLFQIGSISKVWTATVAMALVDEGLLALDTPIAEVLPELRLADPSIAKTVTLRHLLNHTSGIDGDVFTDTGRGDDCLAKYVDELGEARQNHPVGVTFSYCNSGYSVIGRLIEKVTGQTWDQALRDRLLTPLGLSHTATLPEEVLLHSAALGHDEHEGEMVPSPSWSLPRSIGPAGLITSTTADVLAFARMHLSGGVAADGTRVLSEEATASMAAHQADLPDKIVLGDSWGLGWIRFDWNGHRLIGHDGRTLGQTAFLRVLPCQGIAVALLTNGGNGRDLFADLYREIFAEVAEVAMPEPFAPPAEGLDLDVTRYAGVYERAGVRMEVEEGPDGPLLRTTILGPLAELVPDPVEELPLIPAGPGLFALKPPGGETWAPLTFYELPNGESYLHFGVRATPKVS
ncbi:serine hydrolase [Amycolatopsis sp. lyj-90]|uniref:serine hydrolase n=1 Tax=Amycolatopsis sp. lyj-90 TaxID=2789285 RepID=UPI003979102B